MRIITISRQFGSGGREIGKRMADILNFAYYDREIITAIAQKSQLDENYVANILETGILPSFPIVFGQTLSYSMAMQRNMTDLLIAQHQVIKELASFQDCIIVGRNADVILEEEHPFNLFVYADMDARVRRCMDREMEQKTAEKPLTAHEMQKRIKQVDAGRSKQHDLLSSVKWGAKEGYHLCVNTTGVLPKTLAPLLASYAESWFAGRQTEE
ncbi:MAG: cytidylate kinase-like family protein [Firmicutes bacterium]|nr:cytidylate kinase-like family protein [Bacillota bacterium]